MQFLDPFFVSIEIIWSCDRIEKNSSVFEDLTASIHEQNDYPQSLISVNKHYKNPAKYVGLVQSGHHHDHLIKM